MVGRFGDLSAGKARHLAAILMTWKECPLEAPLWFTFAFFLSLGARWRGEKELGDAANSGLRLSEPWLISRLHSFDLNLGYFQGPFPLSLTG